MIKGKTILITGGAGFISSHLIERLVEDNKVIVYDLFTRNSLQYTGLENHPNLKAIKGDVLDLDLLTKSMKGVDICVSAAAIAGIYSVGNSTTRTMKVNLLGTYHALEAAVQNKVKRFIDFSTSEVYGPFVYLGKETDRLSIGPVSEKRWIYALSKLAGEHFSHAYSRDFGLEVVTVRPFNVYGPRQVGEGAIQQMVNRALVNEDITVYNDGTQIRSWCYVKDFVSALYNSMYMDTAANEVFNIGAPLATVTIWGLAEKIIQMTGSKSKIVFKPHPGPEVEVRVPDINLAKKLLNYQPEWSLEDGLKNSIEWYRNNR